MPVDMKRYPHNWSDISHRIRFERANGRCEQCGAPHGYEIVRSSVDPARYIVFDEAEFMYSTAEGRPIRMSEIPDEFDIVKSIKVILTVHHIGTPHADGTPGDMHDKMDCRDVNLIALCQRCHLIADAPSHAANAKRTRAAKREAELEQVGQLSLFEAKT